MNRHQVFTSAVDDGNQRCSVGTVRGVSFRAYATECDIVILASDFQRVQIIPGSLHGSVQVTCIDCSADTGKIAACYGSKVYIYEPTPFFHHTSNRCFVYQWQETAVLNCDSAVTCLSWNQEGTRLLTGGRLIQLWASPVVPETAKLATSSSIHSQMVSFSLGDETGTGNIGWEPNENPHKWKETFRVKTSSPVAHLTFSPDGQLFATMHKSDRLVKVWYQSCPIVFPSQQTEFYATDGRRGGALEFSFVSLSYLRAKEAFTWLNEWEQIRSEVATFFPANNSSAQYGDLIDLSVDLKSQEPNDFLDLFDPLISGVGADWVSFEN